MKRKDPQTTIDKNFQKESLNRKDPHRGGQAHQVKLGTKTPGKGEQLLHKREKPKKEKNLREWGILDKGLPRFLLQE